MQDYRQDAASYYDRFCRPPAGDIDFYLSLLTSADARVLELGCGTGRVLVPMADGCGYIHGLDHSPAMLAIAQAKLDGKAIPRSRATLEAADITDFDLTVTHKAFDLVTAPFRVMQNLATDPQVQGLMRGIKRHLAPGGKAVLNTFRPRGDRESLKAYWSSLRGEEAVWEVRDEGTWVRIFEDCTRYAEDASVVYPILTYRRYDDAGKLVDEAGMSFAMRVWRPDDLLALIESHGFAVTQKLGGYQGQAWDAGSELVVVFTHA